MELECTVQCSHPSATIASHKKKSTQVPILFILQPVLILYFPPMLSFQTGFFPTDFPERILHLFIISAMRTVWLNILILNGADHTI
jgi:hypothetical protein